MRIAYIHDVIYPYTKGGAEKRVWEISKRLARRGHEVHIFGMKYWDGEEVIEKEGVHLHGVCEPRKLYVDGKRSIGAAVYFSWRVLLSFRGDFDIIDAQEFPYLPCFSAKIHSWLRRTPLVITWHEVWDGYWYEYMGRKGIFGRSVERWATRLPDKIIPVSEKVKADLLSAGVKGDKMEVVVNGVDFHKIQVTSAGDEFYDVLYVGRLSEHKNVDLLLRAIGLLRDGMPSIRCGIIGDGPERDTLSRLAKDLKLEENVVFLGFIERDEDVIATMKSSKVFVLPSTREGFGIVLLEANACGVPVIVTDAEDNAASDLVIDGLNGVVSEVSDESMAKEISNLLNDDLYNKMSDLSIKIAKKYDWSLIVDKIEDTYGEVLG